MKKLLKHFAKRQLALVAAAVLLVVTLMAPQAWVSGQECAPLNSSTGLATFTMQAPMTGTYRFWTHEYASGTGHNGLYLQVDDRYCQMLIGDNPNLTASAFHWIDYQQNTSTNKVALWLPAGTHTFKMSAAAAHGGLDKVMLIKEGCFPLGDGANCTPVSFMLPNASLSGPVGVVSKENAIGGRMVEFGLSTTDPTPPPPSSSEWPTPSTTGVPAGITPTAGGPCTVDTPNQVITGKIFACANGAGLSINAPGAVIRNSLIETGQYWGLLVRAGGSLTIEDSTIGGANGCQRDSALSGGDFTARRVEVISGGDAFDVGFSSTRRGNVLIEDSYAKLCARVPAHSDGLQSYVAGSNVRLNHNTIDMQSERDAQTAPIFWSGDTPYPFTLTNNLLIGGTYTIRIHDGTNHVVNGNIVARNKWIYGPTSITVPVGQCSGNQIADVSSTYTVSNRTPLACN